MSGGLGRFISALDSAVDFFIPPAIAADRELRKRAHVFLVSHILGPFIGNVVPIALYIFDPAPGYQVGVLATSITAFWVFPFLLKAGAPYNPLALLSVQNLIFCILWSCYFYGGVTSPTLAWVLTIPLLAFFYLGASPTLRLIVMAMFAVNVAAFCGFHLFAFPVESAMPADAMQGLGLVSTTAAAIYVAMMAFYYAKVLAAQGELEAEMRLHLATAAELRKATEEAEQAGAAKAEFLAKMSHELRTPLNAVIGYSQILLEDAEDEGDLMSVGDLKKIHDAGQHLLKLVNEILDLSKIEAGKMELVPETIDPGQLVQEVVSEHRHLAEANRNTVSVELADDLGRVVWDSDKFRKMLTHLYDNAHKFTQGGQVRVTASRRPGEQGDEIVVAVHDTGIGISKAQAERLFEKFSVIDDSTTSKYGGTGLGLALSQKLCQLMGGEITIESELGQGSRFEIRLPAAIPCAVRFDPYAEATLVPAMPHGASNDREEVLIHG
jgi:signal transduction histidine kinase